MASAIPASAQNKSLDVSRLTAAPAGAQSAIHTPVDAIYGQRIEAGLAYGHLNRPGTDRDVFGWFNPQDPSFDYGDGALYPESSFAGTIAGDGRLYFITQVDGSASDSLGWYDFDSGELGPMVPVTFLDEFGAPIPVDLLPQWVDAGVNTETGEMVLMGRAGACSDEGGSALYSLNLDTHEGQFMMQFVDPMACPLSGAYDNENNRYVGMVPYTDATADLVQVDLTTGETVATVPLPDDVTIAMFIQSAATNYGEDDDPSNNEVWFFLFEEQGAGSQVYFGTARRVDFNGEGVITGLTNFGPIDESTTYVEVLTSGFANNAPAPGGVSVEPGATPKAFEFVGVYPNPMRSAATVMLRSNEAAQDVTVTVYDVLGRQVATLHDGPLSASMHHLALDGAGLPNGVYLVSVRSGDFSQTKKVVLVD